jgi:hypothetical protein
MDKFYPTEFSVTFRKNYVSNRWDIWGKDGKIAFGYRTKADAEKWAYLEGYDLPEMV